MKFKKLFEDSTLPWTLIGMVLVYLFLSFIFRGLSSTCPKSEPFYVTSPEGRHVAHRYYYSCGGATVGFTQDVDVDGLTIFQTYGGGRNSAQLIWKDENTLHIIYEGGLDAIDIYEPQHEEVVIKLFHFGESRRVTMDQIKAAREAVGY